MPVTGVRMPANYPQECHWKLDDLRPGVLSDRAAASSHRARAQSVHQRQLPWHPHAYRAALRVSSASKFSERYLSFPLNFTTFGHFLKPTTTWIVLTKPSSTLLCEKNLAPSKVGLNRKRSDFSDLPNGLILRVPALRTLPSSNRAQTAHSDSKLFFSSVWLTLLSFSHPQFILPQFRTIFHRTNFRSTYSHKHRSAYSHYSCPCSRPVN